MHHQGILKQNKKESAPEERKAVHFKTVLTSQKTINEGPLHLSPHMPQPTSFKNSSPENHYYRPQSDSLESTSEIRSDATRQKMKNEGLSSMPPSASSSSTDHHKQSNYSLENVSELKSHKRESEVVSDKMSSMSQNLSIRDGSTENNHRRPPSYSLGKPSGLNSDATLQKIKNEALPQSIIDRNSSTEDRYHKPLSYLPENDAKLKSETKISVNPEFESRRYSSPESKHKQKSDSPIREKMEIEPNPETKQREKDLDKIAAEIESLKTSLDKELMNQLADLERMAVGHSNSSSLVSEFKKQAKVTLESVTNQANELKKKILEEAIPKIGTINKSLAQFTELKQEAELRMREMESMSRKTTSHQAGLSLRQNPEDLLKILENKIKDSQQLKQDVCNKILSSKQAFQENVNKAIDFYSTSVEKAKDALEKAVLKTIKNEEKKAQSVDLCFMIDFTGSMEPYIQMVREKITHIILHLQKRFPGFQIRISVLGYRDIGDSKRFETQDFCTSIDTIKDFLRKIRATGGQDWAEDVNGAFQKTLILDWQSTTRVIVHITDAPCHGSRFHNLSKEDDKHRHGVREDTSYEKIFEELKKKQINYLFLKIDNSTDKMFKTFKEIYARTNPKNSDLLFVQDEIKMSSERFHEIVSKYVISSVLLSVKQTFKTLQSNNPKTIQEREIPCLVEADNEDDKEDEIKKKKAFLSRGDRSLILSDEVSYVAPKWDMSSFFAGTINAKIYYLYKVNKLKHLMNNEFTFTKGSAELQVTRTPFGKGGFHLAYYCKAKPSITRDPYHMVLKRSIKEQNKTYYFSVLKKNTLAINLSEQFNKLLQCAGFSQNEQIYFTRVLAVKYAKKYYLLEAFIEGQFEKYTNNFTYVNESVPLMSAFSHFTYEFTRGKFMVADLQGSNNLLTDPVVHSFNIEFPHQGDLGLKGMLGFFRYHECNHYCKALHLGPHSAQKERVDEIVEAPVKFDIAKPYKKCRFYYCNKNALEDNLCKVCQEGLNTL